MILLTNSSGEEWPVKNPPGRVCDWDGEVFDGSPIGIPYRFDRQRNKYYMMGYFCSPHCAKKALQYEKIANKEDTLLFLKIICKDVFGRPVSDPIRPAPHYRQLKRNGGTLTIEEFRADSNSWNALVPPQVSLQHIATLPWVEESVTTSVERESVQPKNKTLSDSVISHASTNIKLKRKTALSKDSQGLSSFIPIKNYS